MVVEQQGGHEHGQATRVGQCRERCALADRQRDVDRLQCRRMEARSVCQGAQAARPRARAGAAAHSIFIAGPLAMGKTLTPRRMGINELLPGKVVNDRGLKRVAQQTFMTPLYSWLTAASGG